MIPRHSHFDVEIKKLKFEGREGLRFPHTALVHFHVGDRDQPFVELMGHLSEEEIYGAIDRGEAICLDGCYVEKFSLKNYRLSRNLDLRDKVVLKGFTAREALFSGISSLDLSFAVIEGESFSLEGAWISKGDVSFESSFFKTGETSFHNTRLPDGLLNFKNVRFDSSEITFKNCLFGNGEKDFQYMKVGRGHIQFVNAEFNRGDVNFINTDFGHGSVSFKIARFGRGKVDFHFASFSGTSLSFERTEFGDGRVDFRTVEFKTPRVNFNRSVFGDGEISFDEAEMAEGKFNFKRAFLGRGDLSFDDVVFGHVDVNFERTHFGDGKLSFYRSWFRSLSLAFCHLDGYVDLRVKQSERIDMSNTVVRDVVDMKPHDFDSRVGILHLAGMRLLGRIYLDWTLSGAREMICSQEGSSPRIKAEQFRILKENYQNQGAYSDEDRAYVEFKRHESRAELREAIHRAPFRALYHYPLYWFKNLLFDRAGLYATSPVRVLLTMLSAFVLFSFAYYFLMIYTEADIIASVDDHLNNMARAFYHSAITFLTIGYGDHYPYGAIRWVSALEGFFGLFLMSYFTVAFVRKVLR